MLRIEKKYGIEDTDNNPRNPPSSDASSTDDSSKNEGFLKSAWHKLVNQSKCSESENQPGEQGKKEDGQTSDKNDQKNDKNDKKNDKNDKNDNDKTGNNEEKKSSGSS